MTERIIIPLIVALSACAGTFGGPDRPGDARHAWLNVQYGLETSAIVATACDGGTTDQFLSQSRWQETNPVLGVHPGNLALWSYLGAVDAAMVGAGYASDRLIKSAWGPRIASALAVAVLGIEAWSVEVNMRVGSSFCGIGPGGPWRELPDGESGGISMRRAR